jgi:hypothetical protein
LNPTTAAVLAVGAIGYGLFKLLRDDDESEGLVEANGSEPQNEPLPKVDSTVEPRRAITDDNKEEVSKTSNELEPEVERRELIRQAMSELGKRSAAARAKKKADMT